MTEGRRAQAKALVSVDQATEQLVGIAEHQLAKTMPLAHPIQGRIQCAATLVWIGIQLPLRTRARTETTEAHADEAHQDPTLIEHALA